jgi:excisionase family DNA binding protein
MNPRELFAELHHDGPPFVITEACAVTRLAKSTVYKLVAEHRLRTLGCGKILITRDSLRSFLGLVREPASNGNGNGAH